jgi:hypothetical protein
MLQSRYMHPSFLPLSLLRNQGEMPCASLTILKEKKKESLDTGG